MAICNCLRLWTSKTSKKTAFLYVSCTAKLPGKWYKRLTNLPLYLVEQIFLSKLNRVKI